MTTEIQNQLGLPVQPAPMLERAFWHNSAVFEKNKDSWQGNERLEFLGDAVLELLVSQWLFRTYPRKPEGELTALRAALVCEDSLAKAALKMKLNRWLVLGKGERSDKGMEKPAILADLFEAVLGAIYVEYGLPQAEAFVYQNLLGYLNPEKIQNGLAPSWKNKLQEWVQAKDQVVIISYRTEKSGQDHTPSFQSTVLIGKLPTGTGQGKSKKEAEQQAAKAAYRNLNPQWNLEENADKE